MSCFHCALYSLKKISLTFRKGVCDLGNDKIARDLESNKIWQTEVSCVVWFWMIAVLKKESVWFYQDLWMHPMHMLFGGFSSRTLIGVDGLHLISLWRKAYLQYKSLPYFLFNYVHHLWESFYPLIVSWFCVMLCCWSLGMRVFCSTKQCQLRLMKKILE
jgi:hypothetical protein